MTSGARHDDRERQRRHQLRTTAISSNIKLSAWGKYLGDATVTAAILDRLAMTAVRLDIAGPSYCQHLACLRASEATSESHDSEAT